MWSKIANGAIFEGTKGTIVADFTSRIIIPNNDDGDLTYYKRRAKNELLPLIGGTGQVRSPAPRSRVRPAKPPHRRPSAPLPGGMKALPSAEAGPERIPVIQTLDNGLPPALGLPNPEVESILEARKPAASCPSRRLPARVARRLQRQEQRRRHTAPAARRTATSTTPAR